jgi:hypothetical protein
MSFREIKTLRLERMGEEFSVKARVEKDGTIWLPLPKELEKATEVAWGVNLQLASQSKVRIGVARGGEIRIDASEDWLLSSSIELRRGIGISRWRLHRPRIVR